MWLTLDVIVRKWKMHKVALAKTIVRSCKLKAETIKKFEKEFELKCPIVYRSKT